jgi:hypothetical protein
MTYRDRPVRQTWIIVLIFVCAATAYLIARWAGRS